MEQVQQVYDVGPNRDATCKRLAVGERSAFVFNRNRGVLERCRQR